jgi:hypothetical protein
MELAPVATLPKLRVVALGVSNPVLAAWLFAALVYPTQLVNTITEESVARIGRRANILRIGLVPENLRATMPIEEFL